MVNCRAIEIVETFAEAAKNACGRVPELVHTDPHYELAFMMDALISLRTPLRWLYRPIMQLYQDNGIVRFTVVPVWLFWRGW